MFPNILDFLFAKYNVECVFKCMFEYADGR